MKTLLYFPKLEPHKSFHHIPITALSVASELLAQGHDVTIWDDRVEDSREKFVEYFVEASRVMFTAYTGYQLAEAYRVIKGIKEICPEKKIILGGPHATALPEQTLASPYIDEVFIGEMDTGEHPLPYHLIDIEKYINPATERFAYVSSYSCVGSCTFCQTTPRRKVKFLPLERVKKDIDNLMSLYPFKEAWFADATIFTKPERALFIANLMQKYGLRWICDSRADEICKTDSPLLDNIMNSGLVRITIGMETGSAKVVETMNKGKDHLLMFRKCAEIMSQYDVEMCSGVILGTPGEEPEDIRQTIEYIKEIVSINPRFRISSTFYKPLPRTKMSEMCAEYGYREPDSLEEWSKLGEGSHYNYNQWADSPWIIDREKYRQLYEDFRSGNKELFV